MTTTSTTPLSITAIAKTLTDQALADQILTQEEVDKVTSDFAVGNGSLYHMVRKEAGSMTSIKPSLQNRFNEKARKLFDADNDLVKNKWKKRIMIAAGVLFLFWFFFGGSSASKDDGIAKMSDMVQVEGQPNRTTQQVLAQLSQVEKQKGELNEKLGTANSQVEEYKQSNLALHEKLKNATAPTDSETAWRLRWQKLKISLVVLKVDKLHLRYTNTQLTSTQANRLEHELTAITKMIHNLDVRGFDLSKADDLVRNLQMSPIPQKRSGSSSGSSSRQPIKQMPIIKAHEYDAT